MDPKENAGEATVTQDDLLKSLKEVAGVQSEPEKPAPKKVQVTRLAKSFPQHLQTEASRPMAKALEVSELLTEFAALVGSHVDNSLESLAKSLTGAAERDLTIVEALVALKKSIDLNTETLQKFGETPGAPAAATRVTANKSEILAKSAGQDGNVDPNRVRKNVLTGLELLAKSVKPGSTENNRYNMALITYESTNRIDDTTLAQAVGAFKNPPAQYQDKAA